MKKQLYKKEYPLILQNDKLIDLCEESNENAFGYGQVILSNEIPNLLSSEFAIS